MTKRLLLDCDGVICDCSTPVHRFAEKLLRRKLPLPSEWLDWEHSVAMRMTPDETRDFNHEIKKSDVAFEIQFLPGAEETVHKLIKKFEVVFVTAGWKYYPAWVPAREHLLEPFNCPVIFTHHKHMVMGDMLVDDKPANLLQTFAEPVLFDAPHNRATDGMQRIFSLEEIL